MTQGTVDEAFHFDFGVEFLNQILDVDDVQRAPNDNQAVSAFVRIDHNILSGTRSARGAWSR